MSQLELFEERAAIKEYDGGMTRHEAEKQAREETSLVIPMEDAIVYAHLGWSVHKWVRMARRKVK